MILLEDHPFALAYKLVEEGKLNPWNVDIVELASAYVEEIRRMESLNMRISARAILAASFLLKKKAEFLFPEVKKRYERKRTYTLEEIERQFEEEKTQIEDVILSKVVRNAKRTVKGSPSVSKRERKSKKLPIYISKFEDVLEEMNGLFQRGFVKLYFSKLVLGKSSAPYLMALMLMYYDGKVNLIQEKPYDELIVEACTYD
ncbi:MAG: segregation/condensation protein A [Aquificaceae bacterium]